VREHGRETVHPPAERNLLSFGAEGVDVELGPLNVLIGPNSSGKSNLLEVVDLLHALPDDPTVPIREGGGIREWLWKGADTSGPAMISASVRLAHFADILEHVVGLDVVSDRVEIVMESISSGRDTVYSSPTGILEVTRRLLPPEAPEEGKQRPSQSILAQSRSPDPYEPITYLARQYSRIAIYRDWTLGHRSPARSPQPTDLPGDFLLPDASNLGLVLNALQLDSEIDTRTRNELRRFYPAVERVGTRVLFGSILPFVHERGLTEPVPATRWSDGMLRYLCLLTILCHPAPPPLVCIEEPELGLHPDIIPRVAELLVEASSRMQLIVTTHSDWLVSALSEVPEAVVVCERDESGTHLERLKPDQLREWLEEYTLGDLWANGHLGGTLR
jgi:predicted ATPase